MSAITGNQNWRYETCDLIGCVRSYHRRKMEAANAAQVLANELSQRTKVYDTYKTAKGWWVFFPASEGAQGVRFYPYKN